MQRADHRVLAGLLQPPGEAVVRGRVIRVEVLHALRAALELHVVRVAVAGLPPPRDLRAVRDGELAGRQEVVAHLHGPATGGRGDRGPDASLAGRAAAVEAL